MSHSCFQQDGCKATVTHVVLQVPTSVLVGAYDTLLEGGVEKHRESYPSHV